MVMESSNHLGSYRTHETTTLPKIIFQSKYSFVSHLNNPYKIEKVLVFFNSHKSLTFQKLNLKSKTLGLKGFLRRNLSDQVLVDIKEA